MLQVSIPQSGNFGSIETAIYHHKKILSCLENTNIREILEIFYNQNLLNNPLYPQARISQAAFIFSEVVDDENIHNNFLTGLALEKLRKNLYPDTLLNLSSLINNNKHRFLKQICFGIVTKTTQEIIPFAWDGPYSFAVNNEGLILTINANGFFVSGTGLKPKFIKDSTFNSLVDELNFTLSKISTA